MNELARSIKSYSELQRQFIGAELGRREADSRKDALADSQIAFDGVTRVVQPFTVLSAER